MTTPHILAARELAAQKAEAGGNAYAAAAYRNGEGDAGHAMLALADLLRDTEGYVRPVTEEEALARIKGVEWKAPNTSPFAYMQALRDYGLILPPPPPPNPLDALKAAHPDTPPKTVEAIWNAGRESVK